MQQVDIPYKQTHEHGNEHNYNIIAAFVFMRSGYQIARMVGVDPLDLTMTSISLTALVQVNHIALLFVSADSESN